jgi:hypothetical protein
MSSFQEKRKLSSSINRRLGLSGEMQLQLKKVTAFKLSFSCWNGLILSRCHLSLYPPPHLTGKAVPVLARPLRSLGRPLRPTRPAVARAAHHHALLMLRVVASCLVLIPALTPVSLPASPSAFLFATLFAPLPRPPPLPPAPAAHLLHPDTPLHLPLPPAAPAHTARTARARPSGARCLSATCDRNRTRLHRPRDRTKGREHKPLAQCALRGIGCLTRPPLGIGPQARPTRGILAHAPRRFPPRGIFPPLPRRRPPPRCPPPAARGVAALPPSQPRSAGAAAARLIIALRTTGCLLRL